MAESNVRLTEEMVKDLKESTCGNRFWERYLEDLSASAPIPFSVHLAVLLEPYLRFILDGSKNRRISFFPRIASPHSNQWSRVM